jgi:hypothetical protein
MPDFFEVKIFKHTHGPDNLLASIVLFGPRKMRTILYAVIRLSENAKKVHGHFYHAPWFVEFLRFVEFGRSGTRSLPPPAISILDFRFWILDWPAVGLSERAGDSLLQPGMF